MLKTQALVNLLSMHVHFGVTLTPFIFGAFMRFEHQFLKVTLRKHLNGSNI